MQQRRAAAVVRKPHAHATAQCMSVPVEAHLYWLVYLQVTRLQHWRQARCNAADGAACVGAVCGGSVLATGDSIARQLVTHAHDSEWSPLHQFIRRGAAQLAPINAEGCSCCCSSQTGTHAAAVPVL